MPTELKANIHVHDSGTVPRASAWNSERNVHETSSNSPGAITTLCAWCVANIAFGGELVGLSNGNLEKMLFMLFMSANGKKADGDLLV